MNERERKRQEELKREAERIIKEVENDPSLKNVQVPEDAYDNIMKAIRAKEAQKEKNFEKNKKYYGLEGSEEKKLLLRLRWFRKKF